MIGCPVVQEGMEVVLVAYQWIALIQESLRVKEHGCPKTAKQFVALAKVALVQSLLRRLKTKLIGLK